VIARVSGLTIRYGKRVAVDGLGLDLRGGEIALLLGPNGAGKSTTLAAMAGALLPSGGAIEIDGEFLGLPAARGMSAGADGEADAERG